MNFTHFYMVPFTGLGLHNGFRGDQWLVNRIKIFNQFIVPSLRAQGDNFFVWFCWRLEEKVNPLVKEFQKTLDGIEGLKSIHTFGGIPFWDDKYEDEEAGKRLMNTLKLSLPELKQYVKEDYVLLTIQPSDDMYLSTGAQELQKTFRGLLEKNPENTRVSVGWKLGYIMNFQTKEIAEYSTHGWKSDSISTYHTDTIPPFFTIHFPKETFLDPEKHYAHIGPYKSHEYIADHTDYHTIQGRGFIVGCHGENISTTYNHRYKGKVLSKEETERVLVLTGNLLTEPLKINPSLRLRIRSLINKVPGRDILKKLYYLLPGKYRVI